MPESRDRLVRTVDIAAEYARWRLGHSSSLFDRHLPQAQPVSEGTDAITIWRDNSVRARMNSYGRLGGRNDLRWMRMPAAIVRGTPAMIRGSSISSSRGGVNRALPSWYPRTPFQDITTVARAYDRRRKLSRLTEGPKVGVDLITQGSPNPASSSAAAPIKNNASVFMTPCPKGTANPHIQSVGKILLLDIVNKKSGNGSEFLTPQRKLLNEIDTVREVLLEEIRQFNETPLVKKAERERKVRVLMSMR